MTNRAPETQFQIGDSVLYLPEGIYTRVEGYDWYHSFGGSPSIVGYRLSCGCVAAEQYITLAPP